MRKTMSLAYSSCPNDTFIFYAIAHNLIKSDYDFNITIKDVENLNQDAKSGVHDITKLSFAAIAFLSDKYTYLQSGAALGRGCGPLIVAKPGMKADNITKHSRVGVPGLWTTANALFGLFASEQSVIIPMQFDKIMPAVVRNEIDFGLIIHEGRFTYQSYGLTCIADLGQWWEQKTSFPIPLGGIAIRKDLANLAPDIERIIRESVLYAKTHKLETSNYIKSFAQELDDSVINQHIDLYVNEYTIDIGQDGKSAIETLFQKIRGNYFQAGE